MYTQCTCTYHNNTYVLKHIYIYEIHVQAHAYYVHLHSTKSNIHTELYSYTAVHVLGNI